MIESDLVEHIEKSMSNLHKAHTQFPELRLGQLFLNAMIFAGEFHQTWSELYSERNAGKVESMIREWLTNNQSPDKLKRAILKYVQEHGRTKTKGH